MVALLQPSITSTPTIRPSAPRHLRVVPDSTATPSVRSTIGDIERSVLGVALVAVLLIGAALAVRISQGTPPAEGFATASASSAPVEGVRVGEATMLVSQGDTLWAIAGRIAGTDADLRPVVQQLAERNGGSAIFAGQELIIPVTLADQAALG